MEESSARQVAGQLVYFEKAEKAAPAARQVMAKVALSIAGEVRTDPATVDEILRLWWEDYHAVLALLALAPNVRIRWAPRHENLLRSWSDAGDQSDEPAP